MNEKTRDIYKEYLIKFGRNLCAERNRLGLSQDELGENASIDGRYVSRIERGEINPTLTTIIALLKATNLDFDDLCKIKD